MEEHKDNLYNGELFIPQYNINNKHAHILYYYIVRSEMWCGYRHSTSFQQQQKSKG